MPVRKRQPIPHFEFENWAVIALGGIPKKVQLGDMGIDGRIYPVDTKPTEAATKGKHGETDHMFAEDWFPIQVKQQDKVGLPDTLRDSRSRSRILFFQRNAQKLRIRCDFRATAP